MRRPFPFLGLLAGMPLALAPALLPQSATRAASAPTAGPVVRVLLLEAGDVRVSPLRGRLGIRDGSGRLLLELANAQGVRVLPGAGDGGLVVEGLPAVAAVPASWGRDLWLEALVDPVDTGEAALVLQKRAYRGRLQVLLEAGRLRVINHLDLESYLPSVVGSEMPASWPQQALRAQAVAARTYALRERRPSDPFDLRATVASQVYRGLEAETPSTREAVQATRAQVLTYGGELIQAVFHSSSGSATEDSGAVWSRQLPYLVSVPDFDRSSPVSDWTLRFSATQLRQLFPDTGGVSRFEVLSVSASGRVRKVRVEGPLGQRLISGADLRRILSLRSTQVRFEPLGQGVEVSSVAAGSTVPEPIGGAQPASNPVITASLPPLPPLGGGPSLRPPIGWLLRGRGFGHGVGMSQWGAYGLASQGMDYTRILQHYYRGASLTTLTESAQGGAPIPLAAMASGERGPAPSP